MGNTNTEIQSKAASLCINSQMTQIPSHDSHVRGAHVPNNYNVGIQVGDLHCLVASFTRSSEIQGPWCVPTWSRAVVFAPRTFARRNCFLCVDAAMLRSERLFFDFCWPLPSWTMGPSTMITGWITMIGWLFNISSMARSSMTCIIAVLRNAGAAWCAQSLETFMHFTRACSAKLWAVLILPASRAPKV